jgi:hypothetical protein
MIGERLLHYRVTAKLGQGGMGVALSRPRRQLDRDVALRSAAGRRQRARPARFFKRRKPPAPSPPRIVTIYE